jgi:hypothetical protein
MEGLHALTTCPETKKWRDHIQEQTGQDPSSILGKRHYIQMTARKKTNHHFVTLGRTLKRMQREIQKEDTSYYLTTSWDDSHPEYEFFHFGPRGETSENGLPYPHFLGTSLFWLEGGTVSVVCDILNWMKASSFGWHVKPLIQFNSIHEMMMMRWCDDELMRWWDDEMMRWWDDEMMRWWDDEMMRWWDDEMMRWWDDEMMRW